MRRLSLRRMGGMVRHGVGNRLVPRGRSSETGTVAVIFGIILASGVLLGLGAIVMDTGSLLSERRQLQNGADSTSLAVAQMCAASAGCAADISAGSALTALAGLNAADKRTAIDSVCGSASARTSNPGLTSTCSGTSTGQLVDCPTVPFTFATARYVEVRTRTRNVDGSTILPPILAQTMVGGYLGETVRACARAAWGPPSGGSPTIPVTVSACEWKNLTTNGTSLVASGPYNDPFQVPDLSPGIAYPSPGPGTYEKSLFLHDTSGATPCPAGPSGADLPGGFGWLATSSGCSVTVSATGWVNDKTGVKPPSGCDLGPLVGQTAYIPVFKDANGLSGNNGQYLLDGFAAFYFTGYSIPSDRPKSIATNTKLCTSSQTCLYGWFTSGVIPRGEFDGYDGDSGTPRGAIAVGVAG